MQKIVIGDCLEKMPQLNIKFDVTVTSCPYNINMNYKSYQDNKPRTDYLDWMESVFVQIKNCTKDDGSFFLNMGFPYSDPWIAWELAQRAKNHFILQNTIIWVKSIFINEKTTGHFKPVNSDRYINNNFEYIFHFTKDGYNKVNKLAIGVPYTDKINADRWGKGDLTCRGNCWFLPYKTTYREALIHKGADDVVLNDWMTVSESANKVGMIPQLISTAINRGLLKCNGKSGKDRRVDPVDLERWLKERVAPKKPKHPATFPVALPEMCIKLHGIKPEMTVLDPFVGIGTTLLATKKLNISGIGIEIDPDYAEEAKKTLGSDLSLS